MPVSFLWILVENSDEKADRDLDKESIIRQRWTESGYEIIRWDDNSNEHTQVPVLSSDSLLDEPMARTMMSSHSRKSQ